MVRTRAEQHVGWYAHVQNSMLDGLKHMLTLKDVRVLKRETQLLMGDADTQEHCFF